MRTLQHQAVSLDSALAQCTSEENKHSNKTATNWDEVSKLMNRSPLNCQAKWNIMQYKKMKKGPFTAEEDAIIKQRVAEWGDKGNGLWVSLEKELGRSAKDINNRWVRKLDPSLAAFKRGSWSEEEVDSLHVLLHL